MWVARAPTCLIATVSPVLRSIALYTFPKDPPAAVSPKATWRICETRTAQLLHNLVVLRHYGRVVSYCCLQQCRRSGYSISGRIQDGGAVDGGSPPEECVRIEIGWWWWCS